MFAHSASRPLRAALVAVPLFVLSLGLLFCSTGRGDAREDVIPLLATDQTVIGQAIAYPAEKPAKVTAVIVTMQPGDQTGWHKHEVPLFGYMLEGELTVDYGEHGKRVYRKGDALMEAIDAAHDGHNLGPGIVRILAVFMGAEGVKNTTMVEPPK